MISAGGNTVLGFSLSGQTFDGCGTMIEIDLDGVATGLSNIIISNIYGQEIPFTYYQGDGRDLVLDCSDEYPDCADNYYDCADVCGGTSWVSDCGCVDAGNSGDDCDDCAGTPYGSYVWATHCSDTDGDGLGNPGTETEVCIDSGRDITNGCELSDFNLFLSSAGEVFYNSSQSIAGFQFEVDGTTVNGASGGDAATAG
jgi:hypothetical protein